MDVPRNEVHITLVPNGHHLSTDCWCEPNRIYWYTNQRGINIFVVEHDDSTLEHRYTVIEQRDHDLKLPLDGSSDAPWVSRVLNAQRYEGAIFIPRKEPHP